MLIRSLSSCSFSRHRIIIKIVLHPDALQLTHDLFHQLPSLDTRHILIHPETHFHNFLVPLANFTPQRGNQHRQHDLIAPALGRVVRLVVRLQDLPQPNLEKHQPEAVDVKGLDVRAAAQRARVAVQIADGRVLGRHGQRGVEFRAGGVEAAEVRVGDVRHEGGRGGGRVCRRGEGGREEEHVGAAERLVQPVERVQRPDGHGERPGEVDALVEVRRLEVRAGDERLEGRVGRGGRLVDEAVAAVGRVVRVAEAVDAVLYSRAP